MMRWVVGFSCLWLCCVAKAAEPIRLANHPALSPQGQWLAFDWNGDIWIAPSGGGEAKMLTAHAARDYQPKFSPDGKTIAFISEREGSPQVFQIPFEGGAPLQLNHHTAGARLQEWSPDGQSLLIQATRDLFWRHGERFFTIHSEQRSMEHLLFDDYGSDGTLSPDGKKLLFTREGENWWRKGYHGSRAAQIWLWDRDAGSFTRVLQQDFGCRWPLWQPDGKGFYYVSEHAHGANLSSYDFASRKSKQLTSFKEDAVVFPCITRDGALIVFRHLFDLYSFRPANGAVKKLDIHHKVDRLAKKTEPKFLSSASAVSFTRDGLEMAFIAGGDLWVMDTELREPRQITKTSQEEAHPLFSPDGQSILFTTHTGDCFAIVQATRENPQQYWWQNRKFRLTTLFEMTEVPSRLKFSPDGKKLAYVRGRGDFFVADLQTRQTRLVYAGWSAPDYDWSPDGKWFVHALFDEDFNRDIWIFAADGAGRPYNLSRHPFTEGSPVWSPDGKMIAFTGQRASGESGANLGLVWLNPEDEEKTSHDRKLEKALEKMKSRIAPTPSPPRVEVAKENPGKEVKEVKEASKKSGPPALVIDFERLHQRVKRISLGDGFASTVFWSPDAKKLAFIGTYEGKPGTYVIDVGETLTPKLLTTTTGAQPAWLSQGNQIVWLVSGIPTSTPGIAAQPPATGGAAPASSSAPSPKKMSPGMPAKETATSSPPAGGSYTFTVRQTVDYPARNVVIFETCWRILRDHWYDSNLGNTDWNMVRARYLDMASQAPDGETLTTVVQMMLGELNGSHLGFQMTGADAPSAKTPALRDVTAHLGARFDGSYAGPGLKIRDLLPGGPTSKKKSRLVPGEIVLKIDGIPVQRDLDLTTVLNGPQDREITLTVLGRDGKSREVVIRSITYTAVQSLLYEQWLQQNRLLVAAASKDKFGYLHISQMAMPNFRKFEEELISEGAGKDGLVIDVRENPGGSITDHLLTALTQPVHAITVPRGGIPGYPLDRKVYISWHKPIVVLCNQNSGSNAEIFSHAIKTLKRGQLVGVPTAGAVISTGMVPILDAGLLRLPTRGWFTINDGEDMEKHGAVPHHLLWPEPGQLPQGRDVQLARALEILQQEVQLWRERPQPPLRKATERP